MPFLIKNINPRKQDLQLNLDGHFVILHYQDHIIINTQSVPVDVFAHSLRGELVCTFIQQDMSKSYTLPNVDEAQSEPKSKSKVKKETVVKPSDEE